MQANERKVMLAAVLKDYDRLVLEEIPTPAPGPGQVVVRIKSCGFCATDFKQGRNPSLICRRLDAGLESLRLSKA